MKYQRTDKGARTVLRIEGTLDAESSPDLRPVADELISEQRQDVLLDLSDLTLIDSSGAAQIIYLTRGIRGHGGEVRLSGIRDQPRAIFRLLRYDRVFPGQVV